MPRSKEDIRMDIIDRLIRDTRVDTNNLKVELKDGSVVLSGSVQSFSARNAAESDSWLVKDVNVVENRLKINFPPNYISPSDKVVQESIQHLLSWDPDLYLERIELFVEEGRVILEGSVNTYGKKIHAERLVLSSGGITKVVNKLVVVPLEKISDEAIGRNIISKLSNNSILDVNSIFVEVESGRVILSGIVGNRNAFEVAEDMARYTEGVIRVENHLLIAADGLSKQI